MLYNLKRLTGYAIGFILFYAPVALFQYTDRAYFRWNHLAADTDKHAEYTAAIGNGVLPGACFLRQVVPGRRFYRIYVETGAVQISDKLAPLYRNCAYSLRYAGRLLPGAIFRRYFGLLLLQLLFV